MWKPGGYWAGSRRGHSHCCFWLIGIDTVIQTASVVNVESARRGREEEAEEKQCEVSSRMRPSSPGLRRGY